MTKPTMVEAQGAFNLLIHHPYTTYIPQIIPFQQWAFLGLTGPEVFVSYFLFLHSII